MTTNANPPASRAREEEVVRLLRGSDYGVATWRLSVLSLGVLGNCAQTRRTLRKMESAGIVQTAWPTTPNNICWKLTKKYAAELDRKGEEG